MANVPTTEKFLIEDSTLRGKFLLSTPIYNEISPKLDFGDEILKIFRGEKLIDAVPFDFYGNYNEHTLRKEKSPIDPVEYCLHISGFIIEKERLFLEKAKVNSEIDPKLLEYLENFFPDQTKSDSTKRTGFSEDLRGKDKFLHSKVRYYERPERHQMKRNFQVQIEIENNQERLLTLNDFQNKMRNLLMIKKKLFSTYQTPLKTDLDAYVHELEDTIDIVLNLRPALLKSGIYQTLNQKVKLLISNLQLFSGVYLGKLYCLEVIEFLLREVLELKFGMKIDEVDNAVKNEMNDDSFDETPNRDTLRHRKLQDIAKTGLPNEISCES